MNDKERHDLMNALLEMGQNLEPIIEVAEGQRKKMEERGWSPTAAESVALEMLLGMVRLSFKVQ